VSFRATKELAISHYTLGRKTSHRKAQ